MRQPKTFDPERLEVTAFAKAGATLQGEWPLARFERLADLVLPSDAATARWRLDGSCTQAVGQAPKIRLRLSAQATVHMTCQRCLEAVALELHIDRPLRFVADEREAERLDEESEDEDVLALPTRLDLSQLLEDELILSLPLVPRHEACPQPLPVPLDTMQEAPAEDEEAAEPADAPEHPFAALAALKKAKPPH